MAEFIRGEKWGLHRPLHEILRDPEFCSYIDANPPFNINIQQVSKTPILMDCMVAGPGNKFVELDITSLEPVVIAELSGDETYKDLFGSGKPHDVYLFCAIRLLEMGKEINKVYNIDNPTKESVGAAKKQFKHERNLVKPIHLMSAYRAGARKVRRSLLLSDIDITLEETQQLLKKYWGPSLFGNVLNWEKALLQEREDRGGYILNGLGVPYVIPEKKMKDVMNVASQSTGHLLLDIWLTFVWREIEQRGYWEKCWPAVDDFHDETVLECSADIAEDVGDCLLVGLQKLNDWLKPNIPIKGAVEIADNFTQFKGADPVPFYTEKMALTAGTDSAVPKASPQKSPKKLKTPKSKPDSSTPTVAQ